MTVFRGTAGKVRAPVFGHEIAIEFQVAETFSGTSLQKTVEVRTPSGMTACGYGFLQGREYLVFASKANGAYHTNACTSTRPLVTASAWIRLLRAIRDKGPIPALFGFTGTVPYPGWPHASANGRMIYPEAVGQVALQAIDRNAKIAPVVSRADGSFEFGPLPQRKYEVRVTAPNEYRIWFHDSVTISRTLNIEPGQSCELDVLLYRKSDRPDVR
ncbi:MAG: hypothetical protein ACKV2U_25580 [Bryobacteraceae bacterium]